MANTYGVNFYQGSQDDYDNLSSKEKFSFYYTTDNKNFYIGTTKINGGSSSSSGVSGDYLPLSGGELTGNLSLIQKKGIIFTDSQSNSYYAIRDSGANLWIGTSKGVSSDSDSFPVVHYGGTFISTGWSGETDDNQNYKGNSTIYVSVPSKGNTTNGQAGSVDNYGVLHTGNYENYLNNKYLPLGGGTMTGDIAMGNNAIKFTDSNGFEFPGIVYNGTNLWIGADKAAHHHHSGQVIIAAGYDNDNKGAANETIKIAVGSATTTEHTSYGVLHTGNYTKYCATANHTHSNLSYLPLTGGTLSGSITMSDTFKGLYLLDTKGHTYAGIIDNGTNLWIGAMYGTKSDDSTQPVHHTGSTYISSGLTGTSGNSTIYICVPTKANSNGVVTSANNYGVLHEGNYTDYCAKASHTHKYLPLTGGNISGPLTVNGAVTVNSSLSLSGALTLGSSAKIYSKILPGVSSNDSFTIGDANNIWYKGYFIGISTTSDRRLKENIKDISDKYINLLLDLPAKSYQLINEENKNTHIGFIAQDVEELLNKYELNESDFAALDKNKKVEKTLIKERKVDEKGNIIQEEEFETTDILDQNGNVDYSYALNYSEFIPILTALVQRQQKQIDVLTQKIDNLINGEIR